MRVTPAAKLQKGLIKISNLLDAIHTIVVRLQSEPTAEKPAKKSVKIAKKKLKKK